MAARGRSEDGSLRRNVATAHRGLAVLIESTRAAFERDVAAARRAVAKLRAEIEVHFAQEEHLYYPPIWTLRPEQKRALIGFVRQHEGFRGMLADVGARVERELLSEARKSFEVFAEAFRHHEEAEEGVLHLLDQQCATVR